MWFRRLCVAVIVGSLFLLPVVAADDSSEVEYETFIDSGSEGSESIVSSGSGSDVSVEDTEPSAAPEPSGEPSCEPSGEPSGEPFEDVPSWVEEQAQRDKTMNNNLAMLAGCIMACGGMLIGYWTGSDLLTIWHK